MIGKWEVIAARSEFEDHFAYLPNTMIHGQMHTMGTHGDLVGQLAC